jgi:8-oxo-dGTP pyrophosphatase MutT (NUDIX family)
MGFDMTVPCGEGLINLRVGAILLRDGKFLMASNRRDPYMYSVGGRIQFGETAEQAVVREAEEETGVKVSKVEELLATTLHSYNFYGKWELKLTAWYHMRGERKELTPQQEEGIICAEWIAREEIKEKIKGSFPTIQRVFDAFLK